MKSEMDSNQVWDLVELPEGVKPFGCKWVYKRKRGLMERWKPLRPNW